MKTLPIRIPFEGLYNSYIDSLIDDYIMSLFDIEGVGDSDLVPDAFHNAFTYTTPMLNAIGDYHVRQVQQFIESAIGVKLESLVFNEITSPKYYNFKTNKIYTTISESDVKTLWRKTKPEVLKQVIESRHTSGPGFISFYSNDFTSTQWQKSPLQYDEIQLETLLIAFLLSNADSLSNDNIDALESYGMLCPFELYQDLNCNGDLDSIVFENMPEECQKLANQAYEKESKT